MHVRAHMYTCVYDSIGNYTLHIPQHCPVTVHPPPFFFFSFLEFNFVPTHCPLSLCVLFFFKKTGKSKALRTPSESPMRAKSVLRGTCRFRCFRTGASVSAAATSQWKSTELASTSARRMHLSSLDQNGGRAKVR